MGMRTAALLTLAFVLFLTAGCRYPYEAYRDPYTGRVYYVPAPYQTYTPPSPNAASGTVTYSESRVSQDYLYCTNCGSYYPSSYAYTGCPYCRSNYRSYGATNVTPVRTYTTYTHYPSTYRTYYRAPRYRTHHRPASHRSHSRGTRTPPTDTRKTTLKVPVPRIPVPKIKLPKIKLPKDPVSRLLDLMRVK